MQLVIDIPEEIKKKRDAGKVLSSEEIATVCMAIKNGTQLPKGHGRLIDVTQIVFEKECVWESDGMCTTRSTPDINNTPAVVEADGGDIK